MNHNEVPVQGFEATAPSHTSFLPHGDLKILLIPLQNYQPLTTHYPKKKLTQGQVRTPYGRNPRMDNKMN